MFCINYSNK